MPRRSTSETITCPKCQGQIRIKNQNSEMKTLAGHLRQCDGCRDTREPYTRKRNTDETFFVHKEKVPRVDEATWTTRNQAWTRIESSMEEFADDHLSAEPMLYDDPPPVEPESSLDDGYIAEYYDLQKRILFDIDDTCLDSSIKCNRIHGRPVMGDQSILNHLESCFNCKSKISYPMPEWTCS